MLQWPEKTMNLVGQKVALSRNPGTTNEYLWRLSYSAITESSELHRHGWQPGR